MFNYTIHSEIESSLQKHEIDYRSDEHLFYARFLSNAGVLQSLYNDVYNSHPNGKRLFAELIDTLTRAHKNRPKSLLQKDAEKLKKENWFLSNNLAGMSLYVDRFCGNLVNLNEKLFYLKDLGINVLHLMPLFESPEGESDGGYAVSDFRKVSDRFGTLKDLQNLQRKMSENNMYLVTDIVLNHTSHFHKWAMEAKAGNKDFQDFYYFFDDRRIPDEYEKNMPEVFPESSPGNFTWIPECNKWVMTVFHHYQWDLNYTNPAVFIAMLDTIFFYANLGVDILRIDAPAFIWKQVGTSCQNLPGAHTLLQLIKQCVQVSAPGMALLGEAIVAPEAIMHYFGTGMLQAKECDFAYNATQMAIQWDALATGDVRIMLEAQEILLRKPYGTSWITYTRSHDDIGLGYDDYMIARSGFNPYEHRRFLKNYYSGNYAGSAAAGALFAYNPKTGDARLSGSLASLCGLELALKESDKGAIALSVQKILLMQAMSFFVGGLPMLFYGDEAGYTNDYRYLNDVAKTYDNRWMHRPLIDWEKNNNVYTQGTVEEAVFSGTKRLLALRKNLGAVADHRNTKWRALQNIQVAAFERVGRPSLYCIFNFSSTAALFKWHEEGHTSPRPTLLFDHWEQKDYTVGPNNEFLILEPYSFRLLEA